MQRFLPIVLFLTLFVAACGGGGGLAKKAVYDAEVNAEMRESFAKAERQYRGKNYAKAFTDYRAYIEGFPYNALTDEAYYKIGKIYFLKKDYPQAVESFGWIVNNSPDAKYLAKAGHYAGYAAFLHDDHKTSYKHLKDVQGSQLPIKLRLQFYSLPILMAQGQDEYRDFADYSTLKLYDMYEGPAANLRRFRGRHIVGYKKAQDLVNVWVMTPVSLKEMPKWAKDYPAGPSREMVDYKWAQAYFKDKPDDEKTRDFLLMYLRNYPRSEFSADVQKMLDQLGVESTEFEKQAFKIGVLYLPGGPKSEAHAYNEAILNGVKCAVGFGGACGEKSGIQVVMEESGWEVKALRESFAKLQEQGVSAIVALVPGQLTLELAGLASEKEVPLFLISQQSGLMNQGTYVFQMGLSPEKQMEDLVQAAFQKGYRRFGIYHPDVLYGDVMSQAFENEVQKNGGEIVMKVSYNKRSSDPFAQVRKLKKHIGLKGNSTNNVGFDALFIPDSFLQVNSIVMGLQFHQLQDFPLMGTNTWNDEQLTPLVAKLFPGSFFVDLYDREGDSRIEKDFRRRYEETHGQQPSVLNALGYDSAMMIRHAANLEGENRIQKALTGRFGYRGVTGIRGFEKGRYPVIHTNVIRVRHSQGVMR